MISNKIRYNLMFITTIQDSSSSYDILKCSCSENSYCPEKRILLNFFWFYFKSRPFYILMYCHYKELSCYFLNIYTTLRYQFHQFHCSFCVFNFIYQRLIRLSGCSSNSQIITTHSNWYLVTPDITI